MRPSRRISISGSDLKLLGSPSVSFHGCCEPSALDSTESRPHGEIKRRGRGWMAYLRQYMRVFDPKFVPNIPQTALYPQAPSIGDVVLAHDTGQRPG